jgi:nucleoside-diphosphate-sugar epimerase
MRVCIVGAAGKLGRHMAQHALERGYEVAGSSAITDAREPGVGRVVRDVPGAVVR